MIKKNRIKIESGFTYFKSVTFAGHHISVKEESLGKGECFQTKDHCPPSMNPNP